METLLPTHISSETTVLSKMKSEQKGKYCIISLLRESKRLTQSNKTVDTKSQRSRNFGDIGQIVQIFKKQNGYLTYKFVREVTKMAPNSI